MSIETARKWLAEADALLLTAGAGMGVDSGLPDFRGNEGFWKAYPPIRDLGISFQEMANPHWFESDPHLAWGFYGHRLGLYRSTRPHSGFSRLLDYARSMRAGYFVFTSNVDGQFQKAGFSDHSIVECHGSIHHLQCSVPCSESTWSADGVTVDVDPSTFRAANPLPRCASCGAVARPDILMFGDWKWASGRSDEQADRFAEWIHQVRRKSNKVVIIEIGAGTALPSVRRQSEAMSRTTAAHLIRINPRESDVPDGEASMTMGGLAGIDLLFD